MIDRSHDGDPTVLDRSVLPRRAAARRYLLVVTEGPDRGQRFVVDEGTGDCRALLGQSTSCRIRLSDKLVSRRHASLELETEGLRFVDLESTNGTRVNGLRVFDALLQDGDCIQAGNTVLKVQTGEAIAVPLAGEMRFGKVIGGSPEMRRLYPLFARLAASDIPVVIEGETGTGKEVLAESLHEASPRAAGPFVVFDCTTVAATLVESTLFGHERGAFTGAVTSNAGLFEDSHGGTLFVDEIGDLDLALQAKLLRAIERCEVKRIGGRQWRKVDTRIIAATRRDLDREVQAGRFREDLFFRLTVARVELPPLRRRQGDVAVLATAFWRELAGDTSGLAPEVIQRLEAYGWPGNVRELRNAVAQRIALGDLASLGTGRAQNGTQGQAPTDGIDGFLARVLSEELPFPIARQRVLEHFERRYVDRILAKHGGHVGRAAEASGVGRRFFQTIRGRSRE